MKTALLFLILFLALPSQAQENQYFFNEVDQTEAYLRNGFCRTLNYYWDQAVMDRQGNIHFVFVDNYKLFVHSSADGGQNWTEKQVITGYEGKVYNAMLALTQDDKLVIVYTINNGFNNGTVPYGSEFLYDCYGAVENGDNWDITYLRAHSGNSGLLPFGTITTKNGQVHAILYKYGWNNFGGELYEAIYDPSASSWEDLETIKVFNDRPIDHSTFHVCKLAEGENDSIICVYQRHCNDLSYSNLEVVKKGADGWTEPQVILANSDYATYNKFDLDYDRHGHMYFGYFTPHGPAGPELHIGHNSVLELDKLEPFDAKDTLRKMSIHPYPDGVAYLYFNFKDSLPEIWKISESGLEPTSYLPAFEQEDSADVMRFHYQIPMKNNFSDSLGLFAFTNRYQGTDGSTVLSYPLVFVKGELQKPQGQPSSIYAAEQAQPLLYPNPGPGLFQYQGKLESSNQMLQIFSTTGRLVKVVRPDASGQVDIRELPTGLYMIRNPENASVSKYLKKD